jgi:hypothetical protein
MIQKSTASQINACWSGAFPMMAEEDKDESPHMDTDKTDEEVQDTGPAFDDDLDSEVDDFTIEEDDCLFMVMVHPVDPRHFVRASSTVSGHLAEAFAENNKPKGFEYIVPTSLHTYADDFSETAFDTLPERRKWDHTIELECKLSPGFRKVYPMTLTEQTEMDAFLEEALATGRIRQSKSPLGAPVFFIKKKDGKLRFVQDYQALNMITRKNRYLLPLIDDLIRRLKDVRYFTKLDVRWGYNNVRIRCNVPHKPDLRTANYAPEFPLSVITTAAVFTVSTAAIFTVSTDAVSTASAAITAAVVYVTAAAFTVIAAAASIIAVTAAGVFITSIATAIYTAGSVAVIPTSLRRHRLLHYRTADIVARRLQDH